MELESNCHRGSFYCFISILHEMELQNEILIFDSVATKKTKAKAPSLSSLNYCIQFQCTALCEQVHIIYMSYVIYTIRYII